MTTLGLASALAQQALSVALIRPTDQRSIGTILPDVVVSEKHHDELEMTEHPVEAGATITDHAFKLPATVVIQCGFGASGVATSDPFALHAAVNLSDIYDQLLKLQDPPTLVNVVTGKRLYKNMLIKSIAVETDVATENVLMVTVTCRQVIIATTQNFTVPAPASAQIEPQTTQAITNTGAKQLGVVNPKVGTNSPSS